MGASNGAWHRVFILQWRPVSRRRKRFWHYTPTMGKGYADGPAGEELLAAQERGDHLEKPEVEPLRRFVWGSTPDDPSPHMLGEVGEVDPDELFDSGRAWGLYVAVEARPD
jgi:hypothetical protein